MDKFWQKHNEVYGIGEIKIYRKFWNMKTKISPLWVVKNYIKMCKIKPFIKLLYGDKRLKFYMNCLKLWFIPYALKLDKVYIWGAKGSQF